MPTDRSFLLLHGFGNRRTPDHWQHWLANRLEAAGAPVLYPQLPDPDTPSFDGWSDTLGTNLDALGEIEASERIVLCHSLSCILWMRAATLDAIGEAQRPDRLLLVSPPAPRWIPHGATGFGHYRVDGDRLRASVREEIRFIGSEGDDYNPAGVEATYAQPLGLPFDLIPGAGHISASDGFGPWPAILAWCENPVGGVGATTPA